MQRIRDLGEIRGKRKEREKKMKNTEVVAVNDTANKGCPFYFIFFSLSFNLNDMKCRTRYSNITEVNNFSVHVLSTE